MPDPSSSPWWKKDASVFAALLAIAILGFAATYVYSHAFQRRQDSLSRRWYQRGEADLSSGRARQAIVDLRTALRFAPDNPRYRLRLAQALAASNQNDQAIPYFLNLWEGQPGNALYSLELARLYAREGDASNATRFYNASVYGVWDQNPNEQRRGARLEYIQFLLAKQMIPQARAEAIALAAGVSPPDLDGRFTAADTLLLTGEYERAFREYQQLLSSDRPRAALGAGMAAFHLNWFTSAAKYLSSAVKDRTNDPEAARNLQKTQLVLAADPTAQNLTRDERSNRLKDAYNTAGERLLRCAVSKGQTLDSQTAASNASTEFQTLYLDWLNMGKTSRSWRRAAPEAVSSVMDLVSRIEQQTATNCGTPEGKDWALLTLSQVGDEVRR
jgi:tetratricopeptide (TPR) repeat protein